MLAGLAKEIGRTYRHIDIQKQPLPLFFLAFLLLPFLLAIGFSYYFCTLNIIQYNLEHFRFPEVFFRQTKKAYISFVSPEIEDIANIPNYCTNNYCSNYYCEFIIFFFYHFYFCSFFFLVLLKIGEGMLLRTLLVCVSLLHLVLEVINPRCSFSATNLSLDWETKKSC